MGARRKHKTVRVEYGDIAADIDAKIAPLIRAIWERGIQTRWCCEDIGGKNELGLSRAGWVQIVFEGAADAAKFLNIATKFEPGGQSLYNRITHMGCRGVICWEYDAAPFDRSFDEELDTHLTGRPKLDFLIYVSFPQSDLATVMQRLGAEKFQTSLTSGTRTRSRHR